AAQGIRGRGHEGLLNAGMLPGSRTSALNLTFRRLGVSELLPRYIFAESLFVRRRVLEVGAVAATGGASAEFLVSRGARLVVACDDDLAAVEAAPSRAGSERLRLPPSGDGGLPPRGVGPGPAAGPAPPGPPPP